MLPARGHIAIFNRSYYEDVLVVQVHDLQEGYRMAPRVLEDSRKEFFRKRYRQIRATMRNTCTKTATAL